jgi:photosystem II stability/assembly factor-like uncharacterized protein
VFAALLSFTRVDAVAGGRLEAGRALDGQRHQPHVRSGPQKVYATTNGGGLYVSNDGGNSWALQDAELTSRELTWVRVEPKNPKNVWTGSPSQGFWRSTDGGATFKAKSIGYGSNVGHPVVFPLNPAGKTFLAPNVNVLYRSEDSGATWKDTRIPNMDVTCPWDPFEPNRIYAAGIDVKEGFAISTDAGATWTRTGESLQPGGRAKQVHPDPKTKGLLYVVASRGLFRSTDSGASFTQLPIGGSKNDAEVDAFALDPSSPRKLFAGTRKGFVMSTNGGDSWSSAGDEIGLWYVRALAVHPTNSELVLAGTSGGGVFKSTDGGKTWSPSSEGMGASQVKWLQAHPTTPGVVWGALLTGFSRLENGRWSRMTSPFTKKDDDVPDAIVGDPRNPKIVWVANGGSLYKSTDGGISWDSPVKPMQDPSPGFNAFALEPSDPKTMYSGNWTSSHDDGETVFRSTDGGVKWKVAGKGVPAESVILDARAQDLWLLLNDNEGPTDRPTARRRDEDGGSLPESRDIRRLVVDLRTQAPAAKTGFFVTNDAGTWKNVSIAKDADRNRRPRSRRALRRVLRLPPMAALRPRRPRQMVNSDVRAIDRAPAAALRGTGGGSAVPRSSNRARTSVDRRAATRRSRRPSSCRSEKLGDALSLGHDDGPTWCFCGGATRPGSIEHRHVGLFLPGQGNDEPRRVVAVRREHVGPLLARHLEAGPLGPEVEARRPLDVLHDVGSSHP